MSFYNRNLPQHFTLVDRADGTIWWLSFRESDDRIGVSSTPPPIGPRHQVYSYPAGDGPVLVHQNGVNIRLLVRSSRLGYEEVNGWPVYTGPIVAREGMRSYALAIIKPASWIMGGSRLAWTVILDRP